MTASSAPPPLLGLIRRQERPSRATAMKPIRYVAGITAVAQEVALATHVAFCHTNHCKMRHLFIDQEARFCLVCGPPVRGGGGVPWGVFGIAGLRVR